MKARGGEEEKKHALLFQWSFSFFLSFCKGTTRRGSNRRSMALSVLCTGAGNTKRIKCGGEGREKMSARAGDACAMAFRFNDRGRQAGRQLSAASSPLLSDPVSHPLSTLHSSSTFIIITGTRRSDPMGGRTESNFVQLDMGAKSHNNNNSRRLHFVVVVVILL